MAVYTNLNQQEISNHLSNYKIGELLDFKGIVEGIDNSNFIINTSLGKYILTIFEKRIKKEDLPFFINLKLHLAKNGVHCPRPILDNKGSVISDLKNKKSAIVTFLQGSTLKPREDGYYDNITKKHCREVGKALAHLHLAAQGFLLQRKNDLGINGFRALFSKFEHRIEDYQKGLKQEIYQTIDFLEERFTYDLPTCACHLDLFADNVFFDQNQNFSGVIDFYFAANDALIYDFAITVNAWCFDEKNNFDPQKFTELTNGYNEVRKFLSQEKDFLKIALITASMRFLLTRLHDMFFTDKNSLVKIKNPQEYIEKLRFFKDYLWQ